MEPLYSNGLNCATNCKAGFENVASSNFVLWEGYSTVPSNPSTLYCYSGCTNLADSSYWIGLQSRSSFGSGLVYLVQAGIIYGHSSTYDSHHPVMFEEFWESSGSCSGTTFKCGSTKAVSPSDSMYFQVDYVGGSSNYWVLYSGDNTKGTYDTYYVSATSGGLPYTSLGYAESAVEGSGTTAASYFPSGTYSLTKMVGSNGNYIYQLGAATGWYVSPGSSPTVTYTYSSSSCTVGGTQTTCGASSFQWS